MKTITGGQQTAFRAEHTRPVWFVELDVTPTQYLCTANESIEQNGLTWRGMGRVAFVDMPEETMESEMKTLRIGVAGVDPSILSLYEDGDVQYKNCTVWTGLYGDNYKMIDQPIVEYKGRIDIPTTEESAPDQEGRITATISISVEHRYALGSQARVFRFTDAGQRARHPTDGTLRHIPPTVEKVLVGWGRGVQ